MLERLEKSVDPRPNSVALTALDTAIRQQQVFEETAADIRARQAQEKAERQQKVREEEDRMSQNSGHAVDVFVSDSEDAIAGDQLDQRGIAVDVKA